MSKSVDEFQEYVAGYNRLGIVLSAWKLKRTLYGFSGPVKGAAAVYEAEDGCAAQGGERTYFGFGYYCDRCKTTFFADPSWPEGFAHECSEKSD